MPDGQTQGIGFELGSLAPGSVLSITVSQPAPSRSIRIGLGRIREGKWPGGGLRWDMGWDEDGAMAEAWNQEERGPCWPWSHCL